MGGKHKQKGIAGKTSKPWDGNFLLTSAAALPLLPLLLSFRQLLEVALLLEQLERIVQVQRGICFQEVVEAGIQVLVCMGSPHPGLLVDRAFPQPHCTDMPAVTQ